MLFPEIALFRRSTNAVISKAKHRRLNKKAKLRAMKEVAGSIQPLSPPPPLKSNQIVDEGDRPPKSSLDLLFRSRLKIGNFTIAEKETLVPPESKPLTEKKMKSLVTSTSTFVRGPYSLRLLRKRDFSGS